MICIYLYNNGNKCQIQVLTSVKYWENLKGLMFVKEKIDYGLAIINCNSIHMFFMYQSIDVVMTDKSNKVVFIKKEVKPREIIWPKKNAYITYELPLNTIEKYDIKVGDTVLYK